ncbi:MAG: hypothetical protein G01um101424_119 [Parcubacteria group bacterium Gr01-1014_24]|nr:MAG: hypothetical protein G01um101424_119 [Parcubacteria group bacterium Gr01-1014_24]
MGKMTAKNITIKFISVLLIISIIMPAVLFSRPQKADAQFSGWVSDFFAPFTAGSTGVSAGVNTTETAFSIKNFAKDIAQQVLMAIARRSLQEITKSTVNWINTGRWGNPLFLENPNSFFRDIAKYEVRTFVDMIGYDPLRYPFGRNIALSTIDTFKRKFEDNAQYSLSKVINDPILLRDYRNNFNVGGWNGFLINTQYPQNNYIGFQMLATEELARRTTGLAQNKAEEINKKLQQGMGFLSPQICRSNPNYPPATNPYNPPVFKETPWAPPPVSDLSYAVDANGNFIYDANGNPVPDQSRSRYDLYKSNWERTNQINRENFNKKYDCPEGLINTTPGGVVANQITTAMSSVVRNKELAAAMGNSISAILDTLLSKFMGDGLSALTSKVNPKPPADDWSYLGNTLGSPSNNFGNDWSVGPDEVIVLSDFKTAIDDGINNTETELQLMGDLTQLLSEIWPEARKLDICIPGPNIGWQDRTTEEMTRNSKGLQGEANKDSGEKSVQAGLVLKELKFAVNLFKDWINNKMITELPNSVIYMDAVDEIHDLAQQSDELTDKKRAKTQALARLKAIETALNNTERFSTQPAPGSTGEIILISLKKQYNATRNAVSNSFTIGDTQNELAIAKGKKANLEKLVTECVAERKAKGWTNPGWTSQDRQINQVLFQNSTYLDKGTEQNIFCDFPIQEGYDHESFRHANDNENQRKTLKEREAGMGPRTIYQTVPYVNAKDVLKWKGKLGLFSHSANMQLSCNIIYKANVLDYKGNLPGTTNIVDPYQELPDDTGGGDGDGGGGGGGDGGKTPNPHHANPPGVCASDEEVAAFLENNPGDEERLPTSFPCN